jgi:hypothetical protein
MVFLCGNLNYHEKAGLEMAPLTFLPKFSPDSSNQRLVACGPFQYRIKKRF